MKPTEPLLHWTALTIAAFTLSLASCRKEEWQAEGPEKSYPVTVTAGVEAGSRAVLGDLGFYYWSPGDEIGLFMTRAGVGTPVVNNVRMRGDIPAEVLTATFTGTFSQAQINAISPGQKYDYYSYFPWKSAAGSFPVVQFTIPPAIELTPDRFTSTYAPMTAEPITGADPLIHPPANEQTVSDPIHLRYRHVMSYVALSIDTNSSSKPVTRIEITNQSGTRLSGTLNVDLRNSSCAWGSGAPSLTVDIPAGLDAGQVLYIPMVPGNTAGQTFTFAFYTADDPTRPLARIDRGGTQFVRANIHTLRVQLPAPAE